MGRRSRSTTGRPEGAQSQVVDVKGCPWVYLKPFLQGGKWRARRRSRRPPGEAGAPGDVKLEKVTLPDADSLGSALADLFRRANEEAHALEEARLPPEARTVQPIALEDGWKKWFEYLDQVVQIRPKTRRQYECERDWCLRTLGETKLVHEVSVADVERLAASLATLSARTRTKYTGTVGRLFSYLADHGHLKGNPFESFRVPRDWRRESREDAEKAGRPLSEEEARKLLGRSTEKFVVDYRPERFRNVPLKREPKETEKRAPPEYLRVALALGLLAGLRSANVAGPNGVRWGDLALADGVEFLSIDKSRMKSKRDFRVPINAELAGILRQHFEAERERLGRTPRAGDTVIPDAMSVRRSFESLAKRTALPIGFHDLRRTFSAWLGAVAPFFVVERLLDHSPSRTVTHTYVGRGIPDEVLRENVNRLPRLLEATPATPIPRQEKTRKVR